MRFTAFSAALLTHCCLAGAPVLATGFQIEFPRYRVDEGSGFVRVAVVRDAGEESPAMVEYALRNQTAVAGEDFDVLDGRLSFGAVQRVGFVDIPILNDGLAEAAETFSVVLTSAAGGVLGSQKSAVVTVVDNDPGVEFAYHQAWAHEDAGGTYLEVRRGNDRALQHFSVPYTVTDLTTSAGLDHQAAGGRVELGPGEMSATIWIPVFNDGIQEADERLRIDLGEPSGGMGLGRAANRSCAITVCDATGTQGSRFQGIRASPDGGVTIETGGTVAKRFLPFYRIFPLEASADLARWEMIGTLSRLASSTQPAARTEPVSSSASMRFYRLPPAVVVCPHRPPTGPYAVGLIRHWVEDPSRRNRYQVSTNGSFMAMIWYPANPRRHIPEWLDERIVAADPEYETAAWMDRIPRFTGHSFLDAPLLVDAGRCPILLYSHGLGSGRTEPYEMGENLASHGFIVVSVNHWDAGYEVFPDGRYLKDLSSKSATAAGHLDRVRDLALMLDELGRIELAHPILRDGLDLTRIAAAGFSWGGDTAGDLARLDARCLAAIAIDQGGASSTAPDLVRLGLQKPSLTINRSDNSAAILFGKATTRAYWLRLSNTVHLDLHGSSWAFDATVASFPSVREVSRTINAYVLSFLDRVLRHKDDSFLDGPPQGFPRVADFKHK